MEENIIGPIFPTHLSKEQISNEYETSNEHCYGPQLPPDLLKAKKDVTPYNLEESNVIGPLPLELNHSSESQKALDERAEILKYNFLIQNAEESHLEECKRELWMTELPPEKSEYFGLGPRKFKLNNNGDKSNRSLWTETPKDKIKKEQKKEEDYFETLTIEQRNKAMDESVKKSKKHKKGKKSLLEIHRQKLKKKKKDRQKEKAERRPFDRNIDLQVNRFDEAQKKVIIKKAQFLDSRFSSGKSKYL